MMPTIQHDQRGVTIAKKQHILYKLKWLINTEWYKLQRKIFDRPGSKIFHKESFQDKTARPPDDHRGDHQPARLISSVVIVGSGSVWFWNGIRIADQLTLNF
jgi:hypothetical protein